MATPTCLQLRDIAPPRIFVSSTIEGPLAEVRDLLRHELEATELIPVMSEFGEFSYTHGRNPVMEDTVSAVSTSQFYVLVIGQRYGTVDPVSKMSITEREYDAARAAGLPMLTYVDASVWEGFNAFSKGDVPQDGHTLWVDDLRVFAFLKRVASDDACRCFPFRDAHEIVADFRRQIANLLGGFLRFELRATSWLWTEEYTRGIERAARVVWVLTPNFYWDYLDEEFRTIVGDNVTRRGVQYYYIYRDTEENARRIDAMTHDYAAAMGDAWRASVHYAAVPPAKFNWCTEQAMYDPGDPRSERGVIIDIMGGRDKANKCNIELGRKKRADFHEQFARLWDRYGTGDLEGATSHGGTAN